MLKADLPVVGDCDVTIENETRTTDTKIIIIQGKMDSLPLLGCQTLEELGMVKFDATGGLKQPNRETTKNVHKLETGSNEVVHRHKKLFEGIGKAQCDGQDIEIHLPLKENAIPITQKPWRVPGHSNTRIHHVVFTTRSSTQTKEPERHQSKFGLTSFKPLDGTNTTSSSTYNGRFY